MLRTPRPYLMTDQQREQSDEVRRRLLWAVVLGSGGGANWEQARASWFGEMDRDALKEQPRVSSFWGPKSPFTAEDFDSTEPLVMAAKLAAWRPTDADSFGLISADGVGRQLEGSVKRAPRAWADDPVRMIEELRHPLYIGQYFRGLAGVEGTLDADGEKLVTAIRLARSHPWDVIPLGADASDFELDWSRADEAGVELIEAMVGKGVALDGPALTDAWEIAADAATDRTAGSVISSEEEPLTLAINRPCTRALQTLLHMIEHASRGGHPVPERVKAVLTEGLRLPGQDGAQHRAILAPRTGFLRHVLPEWFESNEPLMFGSEAPEGLGQTSIDLLLRWGRPDRWLLERYQGHVIEAVRRNVDHAIQGLLLGMFWDVPGYSLQEVVDILTGLGPTHVSLGGEVSAQMLEPEDAPPEAVLRGADFWERTLASEPEPTALAGYAAWAAVSVLDKDRWEALALATSERANGMLERPDRVSERASQSPVSRTGLRILTSLIRADLDYWDKYRVAEHALNALKQSTEIPGVADAREVLRTVMLEHGFHSAVDF